MKMKERLYLTGDRSRAVAEDDRSGRYLLCKKGAELDNKVAAQYGLVDGGLPESTIKVSVVEIVAPEVKRSKSRVSSVSKFKNAELTVIKGNKKSSKSKKR